MSIGGKIKTIDNKIEENKAQYNLDGRNAKTSAYYQEMLINMNFHWQRYSTRKRLARKRCWNEEIWIFAFRHRIKCTIWHWKKQYQRLNKFLFLMNKNNQHLKSIINQV